MATSEEVERFSFGPFKLCPGTGELFKAGLKIKLQPQPFRLLLLLISRPGELVTREEIRRNLWSLDTTVEFDQSLNSCVRQIRAVLGEDVHEPKFIETLPKRGYRFIAPVTRTLRDGGEPTAAESRPESTPPPVSRWRLIGWAALAATVVVAFLLYAAVRTSGTRVAPRAILVRPFVSFGLPEEDAWFSDALTQQLVGALAETKALRVVPWSSSLALKGRSAGVGELGKRFHVDAILEGSVGRSGERLRVQAQLVDVATDRILWSHQDERDARDLGSAQDDVMNAIAGTLKLHLAEAATPEARRRPQDLETYNLYLKATVLGDQFSADGTAESVKAFEEVIQRAPNFAPAHAGLANALAIMPFFGGEPAGQILIRSKDAALRAIALDPNLAMAHAALAHSLYSSWDWKESEREFQTALSLDPDSAVAHQLYAFLLGSEDRSVEAIREARRAADLAPTSGLISFSLANVLLHAGNLDEAVAESRRAMELDRGFYEAYSVLVRAYTLKGMTSEALEALNDWERYHPEPEQPLWRAYYLARSGRQEQALDVIHRWLSSSPRASRPPLALAAALLAAGEKDRALQAIRQAVELHVPSMVWLKTSPEFAAIRSDPQFMAALSMMKREE